MKHALTWRKLQDLRGRQEKWTWTDLMWLAGIGVGLLVSSIA